MATNERNTQVREDQEISILQLLGMVRRRKVWVIVFLVLALALACVYLKITNPTYEATATALVEPISNVTSIESLLTSSSSSSKIDTEVQLITSATNLQNALDKLNLSDYLDPEGIPYSDPEKKLKGTSFKESISVSTVSNTKMIKLTVQNGNSQFAADYANAILEAYDELLSGIAKNSKSAQCEFIENQIPVTEALLADASQALSEYKEQSGITQLTEMNRLLTTTIAKYQLMIEPLRLQMVESESLMATLNADSSLPSVDEIAADGRVADLLEDYGANSKELSMYQTVGSATDESRIYVLESSINARSKEILNIVNTLAGGNSAYAKAATDYLCVNASIMALQSMVDQYNEQISSYPIMERKLLEYERDVQIYESLLLSLRKMLEETRMVEAAVVGNVNVIDKAQVPERPVSPKKMMILAVAVLGGAVLGVLFALLLEFTDNTIESEEAVSNILGPNVPSLGWTPFIKDIDKVKVMFPSLFVYNDQESSISERFRIIANNISYSLPEKVQVLAINSTDMNEGKTTVICNIAASYAMSGKKVILIDGDFRKPSIEPFFKLRKSKLGIVDVVVDQIPLETCIIRPVDDIPNLHIIPPGRGTRNPNALYSSSRFAEVIAKLRKVYDYIIIDCPPLMYGSEFSHLSSHLDGFVLNIRSGSTSKSAVATFARELDFVQAPLLGYIFYGVDAKKQRSYGYGSYKYGYGYNYGSKAYGQRNGKNLYAEGKVSKGVLQKEARERTVRTYGSREPVLAFAEGLDNAFVSSYAAEGISVGEGQRKKSSGATVVPKQKIAPCDAEKTSAAATKAGGLDARTSEMLGEIEKAFNDKN